MGKYSYCKAEALLLHQIIKYKLGIVIQCMGCRMVLSGMALATKRTLRSNVVNVVVLLNLGKSSKSTRKKLQRIEAVPLQRVLKGFGK